MLSGGKAKRIIELCDIGMDPHEIQAKLIQEGYTIAKSDNKYPFYVRAMIARYRGNKAFNMRLTAIEREMEMMREVYLDIANSHPKELHAKLQRIKKNLESNKPYSPQASYGKIGKRRKVRTN